ncbi:hypothetical protein FEM48_Zijuj10G0028300 [Ziziphus jujuba var. spinosa]|uniref:Protein indeterminate-domain 5, chloroplastic n=1 Tax=Ziziphus jujuba var. spinosa TaxID=714518 RepID=A0A978UKV5_ZIZJJ|nr:hypothetical protein FEM48_Zijuj10G0028300 [Ziziphus jujuba var. spinosa]
MSAASSSMPFFGTTTREENQNQMLQQPTSTPASSIAPTTAPPKKRRNQPGTPSKSRCGSDSTISQDPNGNKQVHMREPKRKVYLCPEPTCVHHDPSRALGDLTGIKKHYSRKHGEKKWKCEKCSKRYAVQSDWKAHSKTCGTREYRCDCGTLFSRRDSFITHRAFCDALAQESARHPTSLNTIGGHIYGNNHMSLGLSQMGSQIPSLQNQNHPSNNMLRLGNPGGPKLEHLIQPSNPPYGAPPPPQHLSSSAFYLPDAANQPFQDHQSHHHGIPFSNKPLQGLMQLPDLQTSSNNSSGGAGPAAANLFNLGFFSNNSNATGSISPDQFNDGTNTGQGGTGLFPNNMGDHIGSGMSSLFGNSVQHENIAPHMSATALLQKAAQMGSTTSNESSNLLRTLRASSSNRAAAAAAAAKSDRQVMSPNSIQNIGGVENENHLQGLMNSLANGTSAASMFGGGQGQDNTFGGFSGGGGGGVAEAKLHQNLAASFGGSDKLTLDFLGVGGIVRNMGGGYSQRDLQHQQQQHGMTSMTSLDPQLKSTQGSQPFRGTALQ